MLLETDAALPASSVQGAVVAQIAPGYHINDHVPSLDYLIPTQIKFEPAKDLSVEKVVYPQGELKRFAFSDTRLSVYEGKLVIGALFKIDRSVRPGDYALKGKLTYQACNDHACFPPSSAPLTLTVKVVRRGVPIKHLNGDVFNKIQFE